MRLAPVFVMLAALAAACGGKSQPPPVSNVVAPPAKEPWTLDRVFETVSSDAGLVAYIDVARLSDNALLAGYADELKAAVKDSWPCNDIEGLDTLVFTASGGDGPRITIWALGVNTVAWKKCLEATPPPGISFTIDGDYATMVSGTTRAGYLILDEDTIVGAGGKQAVARTDLEAIATAGEARTGLREIDRLRGSKAPIWVVAQGSSAMFQALPMKFRTGALTIDVTDKIDINVDVAMMAKDQATMLAQAVQQQGQTMLSMGFLTALDATATGETLKIHAELTKASIDKMISMFRSFGGGGAISPFGPPGPP